MEFRQIRYALAVARERSFTKAALRLNVSQSAVSEQVRLLEGELGFALFQRTGRGIELTEPGRAFLHEAERVAGEIMSLGDTARHLRGAPSDTLTLGMGSGMAQIFIPRLFRHAAGLAATRLEILTAPTKSIFNDLHNERIDVGIALESDPERVPAGLVFERLTEAEMALIAPPRHALAVAGEPVAIARLADEPFIMSELTVGYGAFVLALFADIGLRPHIVAVADNIETMKVMVGCGGGLAIVPRAAAEREAAHGDLAMLALAPRRTVALSLFRRRQKLSRQKEASLDALRAALADPEPKLSDFPIPLSPMTF